MKKSKPMWAAALLLLCLAAPLFAEDSDALIKAARNGDTATARALISAGADIDVRTSYGEPALTLANYNGHTEIATMLRNAGAR